MFLTLDHLIGVKNTIILRTLKFRKLFYELSSLGEMMLSNIKRMQKILPTLQKANKNDLFSLEKVTISTTY